jgi:regulator of sigma E protease
VKKRMDTNGNEERRYEIGISPLIVDAMPDTVTLDFKNPISVVGRGIDQTVKWTSLTVLSFVRLFQGEVSPKNVGGFFSIGAMAKKSWQIGAPQFLHVMAIISINLFVLNLLPVPVLDGGHLVFYTIEAIKGAPLSMRKMEIAQQVGLVLLLGLMVFALFNDATRMFFN